MSVLLTGGGFVHNTIKPIILTLQSLDSFAYVKIGGVKYSAGTYELEPGTKIEIYATGSYDDYTYVAIRVFDKLVVDAVEAVYTYDTALYPNTNITISSAFDSSEWQDCVYITETV